MSGVQEVRRLALVDAIRYSGLSPADFCAKYLARDRSTIYRWLSGDRPIPSVVADWLDEYAPELMGVGHD